MEYIDFLRLLVERGVEARNDCGFFGMSWDGYAFLADLVGEIGFKCGFDNNIGKCIGVGKKEGCCGRCKEEVGYLYYVPNNEKILKYMARLFNDKTGFWRKNKGCSLPRKLRSGVCLGYCCDNATKATIMKSNEPINGMERFTIKFLKVIKWYQSSNGRAYLKDYYPKKYIYKIKLQTKG